MKPLMFKVISERAGFISRFSSVEVQKHLPKDSGGKQFCNSNIATINWSYIKYFSCTILNQALATLILFYL